MRAHRFSWAGACGAVLLALGIARASGAETITLNPIADATLIQENGALANGRGLGLFAGNIGAGVGFARRGLVEFDTGAIPPGSIITGVSLTLTMTRANSNSGAVSIGIHRVASEWTEGPSHAGSVNGQGAPAQPGDTTWTHRTFGGALWTSPGGDFANLASATRTLGTGLGAYTWASTPRMVADVQGWLASPGSNFGWMLVGDESTFTTTRRFASREVGNVSQRPRLVVEYTVPGPWSAGLAAVGGLLGIARRRKPA